MKKYLFAGIAVSLASISQAQEVVDFRLNPEFGKPLHVNMLVETVVKGPQGVSMDIEMTMETVPTGKSDDAGLFVIKNIIRTAKVNLDTDVAKVRYDSEREPADEMERILADQFSNIIGQKVVLVLSDKAKPVSVDVPDVFKGQGIDMTTFSNIATAFSDGPVSLGESWTHVMEMSDNPMISNLEIQSTYREDTEEGYVVDIEGKVIDLSGNAIGILAGYYILDRATHFTKRSEMETKIDINDLGIVSKVSLTVK